MCKQAIQFQQVVDAAGSQMRFVILEENGGDHGLLRGLGHATYSNMMHRHADFGLRAARECIPHALQALSMATPTASRPSRGRRIAPRQSCSSSSLQYGY